MDISRRDFLETCGSASLLLLTRPLGAKTVSPISARVQFRLVKEIKYAFYRAVSPDSRKICVCLTKKPIGSIALRGSEGQRIVGQNPRGPDVLSVIELETWKEIFSVPLRGEPFGFSFFPDNETLYGTTSTVAVPTITNEMMLINLRTGSIETKQQPFEPNHGESYTALNDRLLIGIKEGRGLILVEWPELKELRSAPIESGKYLVPLLSLDRKKLVYPDGQWLLCRRVSDFAVLWRRQIDSNIDLKARDPHWKDSEKAPYLARVNCAISADGTRVAIAPVAANPDRHYIEILNGDSGSPFVRWSLKEQDGMAFSPDGSMLALADLVGRDGRIEARVHVLEVPSGRVIATLVHDRVPQNQRLGATLNGSGFGFTPDGKYLITSNSFNVKIWQVIGG